MDTNPFNGKKRQSNERNLLILCPKCKRIEFATGHHIFPRKFFGGDSTPFALCRACHDDLHNILRSYGEVSKYVFEKLFLEFIGV